MSEGRDALEAAQARLKALEAGAITDEQLEVLARTLALEADTFARHLERAERTARAQERTGQAARLLTAGFTLLFGMPIVVIISSSLSKLLRHQHELAVALLVLGGLIIGAVFSTRASVGLARWFSAEWRLVRRARRVLQALRAER